MRNGVAAKMEQENIEIESQVAKASDALSKLIQNRSKVSPDRQRILAKMEQLISEARTMGVSHLSIAQTISAQGLKITKHDVAEFCRKKLGEKKSSRSKSRRRQNVVEGLKSKQSQSESSLSLARPKSSHSDIHAPRPGFRVARDEDL